MAMQRSNAAAKLKARYASRKPGPITLRYVPELLRRSSPLGVR